MVKIEANLEELEAKLLSYENFKHLLQQYLQRLLGSDQDTLAVVSEMLDAVKALSSARALADTPPDLRQVVELRKSALLRYGGIAHVEGPDSPPLLEGGVVKLDDPQVYGLSLICTWLDCIVSNPEQSLDSLRKVFLKATDSWGSYLNRTFHLDLGRMRPISDPSSWLADLLGGKPAKSLYLARVYNNAQALGLESMQRIGEIPLPIWKHLLGTKPIYDLTARYTRPDQDIGPARLVAVNRDGSSKELPCLYWVSLDPSPEMPPLGPPIALTELQSQLGLSPSTPVRLEMIEQAEHLSGNAASVFTAHLPLNRLLDALAMILNHPPAVLIQDITPKNTPPSQRLLRISSSQAPERVVQIFRLQTLPPNEWPGEQGWTRMYRFHDLGQIGVQTAPAGSFLQVSIKDNHVTIENAEVYFQGWGEERFSLRISAAGLRRAAQTGSLIFLGVAEERVIKILDALQGLIGPAAQEIDPVISRLDCQVRWRAQMGPELFKRD